MAGRNKRKATKPIKPTKPIPPKVSQFSKGINMRIDPGARGMISQLQEYRYPSQEMKLREIIDMFRYHHPGVKIEVQTHTPGDYVEFYIEGVQRIKVAMTQMATMPSKEIYHILEKGVKYRDPYANQLNNLQQQYQQGYSQAVGGKLGEWNLEQMKTILQTTPEAKNIFFDEYDGTVRPKKEAKNPTESWAEKWAKEHGATA